ncbi:hypothetical protein QQF73_04820 [Marinobacter sp. M216]|uniref:PEP-CTERM protein-sorting domain-containing protein n=1 Tax=Marinobacter albus TaxID=3030833 RepID=A0ABT7HAD6_9GAMM|nr:MULTISPECIES: hypothetical protein [unclassified Marinobacter]MBW7470791.1 hypothetical protein [Marinobacter sp. F4218]MDK9556939.1 hypothetical protein [Marinobacter sp. M216]
MRSIISILLLLVSSVSWAVPITYYFEGRTTRIFSNVGDQDPLAPLVRDDGVVITNGDATMTGQIVFDPAAIRSGAGGTGQGEVLSWSFSTLGLSYQGAGGAFHFLTFLDNAFRYADEVPTGGYGPDVVSMGFDFNGTPFLSGPDDFPVNRFTGGMFSTAIDLAVVNDVVTMYGLGGEITTLRALSVPGPSSLMTMAAGMFLIWWRRRFKNRTRLR